MQLSAVFFILYRVTIAVYIYAIHEVDGVLISGVIEINGCCSS